MDITVEITVPDLIYQFYQKVSGHLGDRTTEEIMASALYAYAGFLSKHVIKTIDGSIPDDSDLPDPFNTR